MNNTPNIRFPGFTDAWEQRKFQWLVDESIIDTPMDGNHGEKHPTTEDYVESGIPFLMASDIHNGIADIDNCKYISEERANRLDKGFARNGDVLITHKATIGEVAILQGLTTDFAMLTPQVTYYRIKDNNRLSQKYLYAWFNSDCFQKEIKKKAAQSTRPYIGISAQRELGISLPKSVDEQEAIGSFIYNIDNLITLHQRELEQYKELKKGCLQKMFPKDGADVPEVRFPEFTDAWEQRKLIDLLSQPVSDGPHETPDLVEEGIPFISVDAIVDNKIDFDRKRGYITEEYDLECRKKYSPQRDDVYLVKSGATVGKVAIVDTDERFNIWSPLAAMRANKKLMLPKYLYFYLQLKDVQDEIYEKSIGGTQPNLSMRILEQFNIRVPHIDEQEKISDALSNLDNLITLHQRELEQYKLLKKGLLQRMFV